MQRSKPRQLRAKVIAQKLERLYPEAQITLDFSTPWQCLVATILSAQSTDARVNQLTPHLFSRFPDPASIAGASASEIERLIKPAGFYRQKARLIIRAARAVLAEHQGRVPSTMAALTRLPGVGRKTANVVLGHVFGQPALPVDTHVKRVAYRLGLTASTKPETIERDLQRLLPPTQWTAFSMRLILHGRRVCGARKPRCESCDLRAECRQRGVSSN